MPNKYKITDKELNDLREACYEGYRNPKTNGYAKTYMRVLIDGSIYLEAKQMGRTRDDALRSQIPYILSNLRATTPELKALKKLLIETQAKLGD